jgi:hypothetical protein
MRVVAPIAQPARGPSRRAVALLLGGGFVVAAATTLLFLGMRSVMDVGGFCAEGGPYVIETPCPAGSPAAMLLGIFGWFAGAALLFAGGVAVGGAWGAVGILAWSALFGALGWNFLEYALADDAVAWGWLVCGLVFEAMAIAPLLVVVPAGLSVRRAARAGVPPPPRPARPVTTDPDGLFDVAEAGTAAEAGTVDADGRAGGADWMTDADWMDDADKSADGADGAAHEDGTAAGADDPLVASLQKLAALHEAGLLTDEEFARAKDAVLDAAEDRS